jgi:hypothetical protein
MRTTRFFLVATAYLLVLLAAALPAAADSDQTVYVTAQSFVGGKMVWRSDTGHIWVLLSSGSVDSFPALSYTNLPDNPYTNPPAGYIRPINGFGKVWGNHTGMRNRLGWAITSELGFYAQIVTRGGYTYLTELNSQVIEISPSRTWQYVAGIPPLPSSPANNTSYTQAAYQQYERGFMLWRADTGAVMVFFGGTSGQMITYAQNTYGTWPDNPIVYTPPGFTRSINGFGKVWGSQPPLRDGIGYALGPEEAFTMTVQTSAGNPTVFSLPDGRSVNVSLWSGDRGPFSIF